MAVDRRDTGRTNQQPQATSRSDATATSSSSPVPYRHRATIEQVADAAGVSVATVSRALRGLPNVAAATRLRVEEVAKSLGYRPDPAAARLAAGRTSAITAAVPDVAGWFAATVIAGLEAMCTEAGYDLVVASVPTPAAFDRLVAADNQLERRTDGLVTVDIDMPESTGDALRSRGIAVATIGTTCGSTPSVTIDNVRVGRLATDHLLQLGHRRIGLIGQAAPDVYRAPQDRELGYREAHADAGVEVDESLLVPGGFRLEGGSAAMEELLALDEPPTAVFAMSDEMAFGCIITLREHGLVAGRDISVVGVDMHEFARVVDLTTVRQPVAEHGARAARLVLEQLDSERSGEAPGSSPRRGRRAGRALAHVDTHYEAPVELIVGSTTAPLSS